MRTIYSFKKILFCLGLLLSSQVLTAQTLTCQTHCSTPGQIFSVKTSSPIGYGLGTNQLWNCTQILAVYPTPFQVSFVSPASVPAASLYPQANVVKLRTGGGQYGDYYILHTDNNGVRGALSTSSSLSAEPMLLPLPFSYGNTYSQSILSTIVSGSDTIINTEVRTFTAVGTGTLLLPSGTFDDVISVHGKSTLSSTKNGLPFDYVYYDKMYFYYSHKIAYPLAYTSYKSDTSPTASAPYTEFIDAIVTGIEGRDMDELGPILLYPNPANAGVKIELPFSITGKVILANSMGAKLKEINDVTVDVLNFDLTEYPTGMYFLLFSDNFHSISKKLLISR
jgi:hypothetical protein